jgi:hypothetical protein
MRIVLRNRASDAAASERPNRIAQDPSFVKPWHKWNFAETRWFGSTRNNPGCSCGKLRVAAVVAPLLLLVCIPLHHMDLSLRSRTHQEIAFGESSD